MPPKDFIQARKSNTVTLVDERPYFPQLSVTLKDSSTISSEGQNSNSHLAHSSSSIITTALAIIFHPSEPPNDLAQNLKIKTVTGGITNALYCITGFSPIQPYDSVLIRVFGAEGMIDRDIETSTFAHLASSGIAPHYFGRFANGRIEGYLENCSNLVVMDLQKRTNMEAIAKQMAHLHQGFKVPPELQEYHNHSKPGLWTQLHAWMKQASAIDPDLGYKSKGDAERAARLLNLTFVEQQLKWVEEEVVPKDSRVAFCHNDLLPANIMKYNDTGIIRLIDFEYGGINFVGFDIANHFNEFAGGPEKKSGDPDYSLFPDASEQKLFITSYVRESQLLAGGGDNDDGNGGGDSDSDSQDQEVAKFSKEINAFVLANHLYWGLWAVIQAAIEGTEEFDYLAYAWHRFNRYTEDKQELEF
eukprot:scaffold797_cov408-Chaetoceros_neogracile.AAC.52